MSDDALLATMTELTTYLNLRDEHRAAIGRAQEDLEAAQDALVQLEGEILRLRAELLGHLHEYARGDQPIPLRAATPEEASLINVFSGETKHKGRPKGSKDKQPRKPGSGRYRGPAGPRAPRPVREIASGPALEALETIKASGPEGVPARQLKPWVIGLLARAHYAKKLPNGNWVAA